MFDFIDFILKLWYNTYPETTLKVMVASGMTSGGIVYLGCKWLENHPNFLKGKKMKQEFKEGDKVKIIGVRGKKDCFGEYRIPWGTAQYLTDWTWKGKIGTLVEGIGVFNDDGHYRVKLDGGTGWRWFHGEDLELVKESSDTETKGKTMVKERLKVGDKVKIVKVDKDASAERVNIMENGFIGEVVEVDGSGIPYRCAFKECTKYSTLWFKEGYLELVPQEKEVKRFKVGDYVKTDISYNGANINSSMEAFNGKTGVVSSVEEKGYRVNSPILGSGITGLGYFYNEKGCTPSTLEQYNIDNNITKESESVKMEENKWIAFVDQIPNVSDKSRLEYSEDAKSWRLKPEIQEVQLVSSQPEVKETVKMSKKEDNLVALPLIPITDTTALNDEELYLVVNSNGELEVARYLEEDGDPTCQFNNDTTVAFYLPLGRIKIPSQEEIDKVMEESDRILEEEAEIEGVKEQSLEDVASNWGSYSSKTKEAVVKLLREKGIEV